MRTIPTINGRRGAVLILFTVLYVVVGYSFITNPDSGTRFEALRWLAPYAPLAPFAALWIVAAALAAVAAFMPRPDDRFGFMAIVFTPAIWGALFFVGGLGGNKSAFTAAAIYWGFSGIMMIVSGMQGDNDRDCRKLPA